MNGHHAYEGAGGIGGGWGTGPCRTCGGNPNDEQHVVRFHAQEGGPLSDAMRWSPEMAEHEMSLWQEMFNDRRREGRRHRPT